MKTIIFNGSPRKNGDTVFAIDELKKRLNGEVRVVAAYYDHILPCTDCRYCWKNDHCRINDEMEDILRDVDEADNIVIASPIYFSELTGALLNCLSRLQYLWVSKNIRKTPVLRTKPRRGFVILVGGGDGKADKALSTAKCLLNHMGAPFCEYVVSHHTDSVPAERDSDFIDGVHQMAERMNANES